MNTLEEITGGKLNGVYVEVPFPPGITQEIVLKALAIDKMYCERGYGFRGTPNEWEIAGQTTSKLRVVVSNPQLYDPEGTKKRKYEAIIEAFDIKSEAFPPTFDPKTGTYLNEGT